MRVKLPEFNTDGALVDYVKKHKKQLAKQKKSMPIPSDVCKFGHSFLKTDNSIVKSIDEIDADVDTLRVKVVANTANWVDSHHDVLLPNSPAKSISERKALIPHLHDHVHQTTAKIGEVHDILLEDIPLKELGIDMAGTAQGVVFITDVMKSYNESIFNQYKAGRANQHSIGLQYVQLELAVNEQGTEEGKMWANHYGDIINKEEADKYGFFWVVKEYKLIENSTVLFGSNSLTPTLDNNLSKNQPDFSTGNNPADANCKRQEIMKRLLL